MSLTHSSGVDGESRADFAYQPKATFVKSQSINLRFAQLLIVNEFIINLSYLCRLANQNHNI